jgi:hypothetical protein
MFGAKYFRTQLLPPTSRQPSNAGWFRMLAFTRSAKDSGKEKKEQVKPALRLPAGRQTV